MKQIFRVSLNLKRSIRCIRLYPSITVINYDWQAISTKAEWCSLVGYFSFRIIIIEQTARVESGMLVILRILSEVVLNMC